MINNVIFTYFNKEYLLKNVFSSILKENKLINHSFGSMVTVLLCRQVLQLL